ncbi:MAG: bifunctional DNA-formamidopyrimidine glycosylase/DNA-(apurinic or apyrimidinic site) lyase [Alphaproteobacteria bacterium]
MLWRRIESVMRRGKYIAVFAEGGCGFVLHLGMSGVIRIEPTAAARRYEKHDHVEFLMEGGERIVFNDSRRFGFVEALDACGWQNYRAFAAMGPEPLSNDFNGPVLAQTLLGRTGAIKTALLDQKIVAGIGNIYACEALYAAGIDPQRGAGDLSEGECARLAGAIKSVLRAALEAGGSSLKDYRHADGKLGYFQTSFAVYDREGEACGVCDCDMIGGGCGVHRIVQGGRSTFYCSQKQR